MGWVTRAPAPTIQELWASSNPGFAAMHGLLGLLGVAAMASRLHLLSVRQQQGLAAGRWSVHVRRMRRPQFGDGGDDFRQDAHAAYRVAVRHEQGWDIGVEPEDAREAAKPGSPPSEPPVEKC